MNSQPRVLYLLNFISMWECFSFYGMRVLLLLFLVTKGNYTDERAFCLYALYTTLVEVGGVLGGFVADRWLGLTRSVAWGGNLIAAGHLCLAIDLDGPLFFFGLSCIVVGTALFRSNVAALLGTFYGEGDARRESGYTLYYAGINLGGFLASFLCALAADRYGWHAGFGLAFLGMMLGRGALSWKRSSFGEQRQIALSQRLCILGGVGGLLFLCTALLYFHDTSVRVALYSAVFGVALVTLYQRRALQAALSWLKPLGLVLLCQVLFYACEEQIGSSLLLFSERYVDRGSIPAATLVSLNPLTILVMGYVVALLLKKRMWKDCRKVGVSFGFLVLAFFILYLMSTGQQEGPLSLRGFLLSMFLISLGELFIGPTLYARASEVAPCQARGVVMGSLTMGFSLASALGGFLSQATAKGSLAVYSKGFLVMMGISLMGGLIAWFGFSQKKERVYESDCAME